jgi:predicted TIM-barrel fold metal-dependent hydrolase
MPAKFNELWNTTVTRLIDVHVHFYAGTMVSEQARQHDQNMLRYARDWGIGEMWASCLGSWGIRTPAYMADMVDTVRANDFIHQMTRNHPGWVLGYCMVNPIYGSKAVDEMRRCFEELGFVGLKLAGGVRATHAYIEPVMRAAIDFDVPILHHIIQRRYAEKPNIEVTDASELAELARRYPEAKIIAAHIGGGGDWEFGIKACRDCPNVYVDISGSGTDSGMLEMAVEEIGPPRLLFGTDLTMDTGLAKLAALPVSEEDREQIAWKNAQGLKSKRL